MARSIIATGLVAVGMVPIGVAMLTITGAAHAQDAALQAVLDRLDRYERDLATMQREFYGGEIPAGGAGAATSTLTPGQEMRLSRIEEQLRTLTGQIEEAQYRLRRLGDNLERIAADYDARMQALEGTGPAYARADTGFGLEPGASEAPSDRPVPETGPETGQVVLERDPNRDRYETMGTLGTVGGDPELPPAAEAPPSQQVAAAGNAAVAPAVGNGADEQTTYDAAYQLLRQADYDQAEVAFKGFVDRFPASALSGHAHYWLGETYYVRGRFDDAAVSFARGYKTAPDGAKAPDNLLKLGMTFIAMDKTTEACATFGKLQTDHPNAPSVIQERLNYQLERAGCP